jgi:hypothetical protein
VTPIGYGEVGGLDVAMNDAIGVRGIEGISDLDPQVHQATVSSGRPIMVPSGSGLQVIHHNERASLEFTDLMDRADVRMIKRGSGTSFAAETLKGLWILGDIVRQKLECHETVESGVLRLVDRTHAAATQLLQNAVVRDGRSLGETSPLARPYYGPSSRKSMHCEATFPCL